MACPTAAAIERSIRTRQQAYPALASRRPGPSARRRHGTGTTTDICRSADGMNGLLRYRYRIRNPSEECERVTL
jgi:hypothetical protein